MVNAIQMNAKVQEAVVASLQAKALVLNQIGEPDQGGGEPTKKAKR